jgi:hypothetical protein
MAYWKRKTAGLVVAAFGIGVYLLNCSWLAPRPSGRPTLLAQRGIHRHYKKAQPELKPLPSFDHLTRIDSFTQ